MFDLAALRRETVSLRADIRRLLQPPLDPKHVRDANAGRYPAWMLDHQPRYGKARKKVA